MMTNNVSCYIFYFQDYFLNWHHFCPFYLVLLLQWNNHQHGIVDDDDDYQHLPKISYQQWKEIVSSKKRFDYKNSREDIFYKIIYPLFPKEFLFGNDLEEFLKLVNETFILNDIQLEIIVEHWKEKENILV